MRIFTEQALKEYTERHPDVKVAFAGVDNHFIGTHVEYDKIVDCSKL